MALKTSALLGAAVATLFLAFYPIVVALWASFHSGQP
jgi:hypothetical protein